MSDSNVFTSGSFQNSNLQKVQTNLWLQGYDWLTNNYTVKSNTMSISFPQAETLKYG